MKVAVYYKNSDVRIEERPKPEISDGEILVKMKASGICGTDVMEWYRIRKAPRVLGHEMAGEIVESKSDKYSVGERVFVSHHVPCNACKYCRAGNHTACETLHKGNYEPGGFSEFIRVPKINVDRGTYRLPKNISYEEATMIEPLACVLRAQRIMGIKRGETVLVMGCGVSGLLHIMAAKLKGAKVIATDINEFRLKKAKELGAEAINANEERVCGILNHSPIVSGSKASSEQQRNEMSTSHPRTSDDEELKISAEHIIMCTGAMPAFEKAFKYADKKGTIMLFAIPKENIVIPNADFWRNELTLVSSYGAAPRDLYEALKIIDTKRIDVAGLITERLSIEEIQKGFDIASAAKESLKVVIVAD